MMVLIVLVGSVAVAALLVPGGLEAMQASTRPQLPAAYLAANLVLSFGAAVAGGWLTARIGAYAPLKHAAVLATVIALMSIPMLSAPQPGQPSWYGWAIAAAGVIGSLAGGALVPRQAVRVSGDSVAAPAS
ncbi:MAG TPA: hypothetical protein VEX86_18665 [Longimicrobium sp.]|nr:hypothetical protein [Longimicrobium sp.]